MRFSWRLRGLPFPPDLFYLIFIFLLGLFIRHTEGGIYCFWSSGWIGAHSFSGCFSLWDSVSLRFLSHCTILYAPGCLSRPKKSSCSLFPHLIHDLPHQVSWLIQVVTYLRAWVNCKNWIRDCSLSGLPDASGGGWIRSAGIL